MFFDCLVVQYYFCLFRTSLQTTLNVWSASLILQRTSRLVSQTQLKVRRDNIQCISLSFSSKRISWWFIAFVFRWMVHVFLFMYFIIPSSPGVIVSKCLSGLMKMQMEHWCSFVSAYILEADGSCFTRNPFAFCCHLCLELPDTDTCSLVHKCVTGFHEIFVLSTSCMLFQNSVESCYSAGHRVQRYRPGVNMYVHFSDEVEPYKKQYLVVWWN